MPTNAMLAKPESIIRIAPASGVFGSSTYVGDEEGFCARVVGKWYSQINNTFAIETPQHMEAARELYDFYLRYRSSSDAGQIEGRKAGGILRALYQTGNIQKADDALANALNGHAHISVQSVA